MARKTPLKLDKIYAQFLKKLKNRLKSAQMQLETQIDTNLFVRHRVIKNEN